jgi:hypothetical protein
MDTIKIMDEINKDRRRFFGAAATAVAAPQLGMIGPAAAQRAETKVPAIKAGANQAAPQAFAQAVVDVVATG